MREESIKYLVGYERDNEFWCCYETYTLKDAREFLNSKSNSPDYDVWYIYEKKVSHKIVEVLMLTKQSKEQKLAKAMISSM